MHSQTDIPEISIEVFHQMRTNGDAFFLLDVRSEAEYAASHIDGYLIPLDELPNRLCELNPEELIIAHCRSGGRSKRAAEILQQNGFKNVFNLQGGLLAWQAAQPSLGD